LKTAIPPDPLPWWDHATIRWMWFAAFIFIYGTYRVSVNVLWTIGQEQPVDWIASGVLEMWGWSIWIGLTPLLLAFAKRFPLEKPRFARHLLFHFTAMSVVCLFHVYLWKGTEIALREGIPLHQLLIDGLNPILMFTGLLNNFYKYIAIVGLFYAIDYFRKYRIRELEAARLRVGAEALQRRLTQAKLDALRMQINPHFLFNTLNTIGVLLEENTHKAGQMLIRLSDLLRLTLKHGQTQQVPLEIELSLVGAYLAIEQIRFEDRLEVTIDAPANVAEIKVPPLLIQPLAENAIRHGVAERIGKGCVQVRCRQEASDLVLEVKDNGPGLGDEAPRDDGIGLKNVRARLEELYGGKAELRIWSSESGTTAQVRIPQNSGRGRGHET